SLGSGIEVPVRRARNSRKYASASSCDWRRRVCTIVIASSSQPAAVPVTSSGRRRRNSEIASTRVSTPMRARAAWKARDAACASAIASSGLNDHLRGFLGCHHRDVLSAAPDIGGEVHVLGTVPRLEGGAASRGLRGGEPLKAEALNRLAGRAAVPDDNLGVH